MSVSGQSGCGKIRLFEDFLGGPDVAVSNTDAIKTSAASAGPFSMYGSLAETDCGLVLLGKASGYGRITGTDEDGYGLSIGTEVNMSPALNGPIIVEARVEHQALTTRTTFVGLMATAADDIAEPITCATTVLTKVCACVGFLYNSELTTSALWYMPYLLATDSTQTSTNVASSQVPVAAESDILRLVVNSDGSAEWWINGKLEQIVGAGVAATTTTLMAAIAGTWGTTTTVSDLDIDYLLVEANRDWTR